MTSYRLSDIRLAMNSVQRSFVYLSVNTPTDNSLLVTPFLDISTIRTDFNTVTHDLDRPPSYDQAIGVTPDQLGDSKFFAPLDELDVRRIIANATYERLTRIEIVDIKNFISFHVRPTAIFNFNQ